MQHVLTQAGSALWKTVVLYFLLLALLRLTGKRELGTLSAIDMVGLIMISEAALISIADDRIPLLVGMTPVLALALLQLVVSFVSLKSGTVRSVVVGRPAVLVEHGRINRKAMAELRYSVHDLLAALRGKNVANISDVEYAVMETTGDLSVIPKPTARPATPGDLQALQLADPAKSGALAPGALPAPLVVDGAVDEQALRRVGKDRDWLLQALRAQGVDDPAQVLLASLDGQGNLFVQKREAGDGG